MPTPLSTTDRLCPLGRLMARVGFALGAATRLASNLLGRLRPAAPAPRRRPRALISARRAPVPSARPEEDAAATLRRDYPAIARALEDPHPLVRLQLLDNLEELEDLQAHVVLLELLNAPETQVRQSAAAAAGRIGLASMVFALILALEDPEPAVQTQAGQSLERLTGQPVQLNEAATAEERQRLVEELKEWWKEHRLAQLRAVTEPGR